MCTYLGNKFDHLLSKSSFDNSFIDSVFQSLPDTLPLPHSEEDNYQKVTIVIEKVERVFREITTTKKILGPQGQLIESTQDVVSPSNIV